MPPIPVTFVVVDDTLPIGAPLEDVLVRVYSEDGSTFITEGMTDSDGELVLILDDMTTFWVRLFKPQYAFDSKLLITTDSTASSNTFDVVGRDLVEHPPSAVPYLCRASGYVVNSGGQPTQGAIFEFNATDLPKVANGQGIITSKIIVRSEEDGYVEVELVRGGAYDVIVTAGEDAVVRTKVPEKQAVDITDLVWPYVAGVSFDPTGPLTIAVDDTVEVLPSVLLSSGVTTPFEMDEDEDFRFGRYIRLSVEDESVVRISQWKESSDTLVLVGKAPGTTKITASLRDGVEAKRLPVPTRAFQELTITVT